MTKNLSFLLEPLLKELFEQTLLSKAPMNHIILRTSIEVCRDPLLNLQGAGKWHFHGAK